MPEPATSKRLPTSTAARADRPGNLAPDMRWWRRALPYLAACLAGMGMTAAFPPLSVAAVAWFGLVPLLFLSLRDGAPAWRLGYAFGWGHYATAFAFLNHVAPGVSLALAAVCAVFPACWTKLLALSWANLRTPQTAELHPRTDPTLPPPPPREGPGRECLLTLIGATAWVTLEWIRSWAWSGFPWNPLGLSQWRNSLFLELVAAWGLPAVTFLVAAGNLAFFFAIRNWWSRRHHRLRPQDRSVPTFSAPLGLLLLLLALAWMARQTPTPAPPDRTIRIACIQANMPLIRAYTEAELAEAMRVHLDLSRAAASAQPDLIVWPETAIPASLTLPDNADLAVAVQQLRRESAIPYLIGTIHYDLAPGATSLAASRSYNAAALYADSDSLQPTAAVYKTRIVPFGEFVPFESYLPWLNDLIGMGRSLSPGRGIPLLAQSDGAPVNAAVSICYEDVFREPVGKAVRAGAQMLLVITNDVWFADSSGAEQHRINGLVRAVETGLPMLRAGNNSETMLILPNGRLIDPLRDPDTGNSFVRGWRIYKVPVHDSPQLATGFRRAPILAGSAAFLTLLVAIWCTYRSYERRRKLMSLVVREPA